MFERFHFSGSCANATEPEANAEILTSVGAPSTHPDRHTPELSCKYGKHDVQASF